MRVLNIDVSSELLNRWCRWFAPPVQPFRVDDVGGLPDGHRVAVSAEVRDTFHMYGGSWIWLDEATFTALAPSVRRRLLVKREASGRRKDLTESQRGLVPPGEARFPWWPSTLDAVGEHPAVGYVLDGVKPSRHDEVPDTTWRDARSVLPCAERLAGTFPARSGPNCFGTVMAAAGVAGAEWTWMFPEPFQDWLDAGTYAVKGTGFDDSPGVVLVWRDARAVAVHAAVTIGGGYVLNKPSQAWCSPRLVWTVRETVNASRYRGLRLHRYRIVRHGTDASATKGERP